MLCVPEIRIKTKFNVRPIGTIINIIMLCVYNSCVFFFLNFSFSENKVLCAFLLFSSPLFSVQDATFYSNEGSKNL